MSDKTPEEERKEAPQSGADAPVPAQPSDESAAPGDAETVVGSSGGEEVTAGTGSGSDRLSDSLSEDSGAEGAILEPSAASAAPPESAPPESAPAESAPAESAKEVSEGAEDTTASGSGSDDNLAASDAKDEVETPEVDQGSDAESSAGSTDGNDTLTGGTGGASSEIVEPSAQPEKTDEGMDVLPAAGALAAGAAAAAAAGSASESGAPPPARSAIPRSGQGNASGNGSGGGGQPPSPPPSPPPSAAQPPRKSRFFLGLVTGGILFAAGFLVAMGTSDLWLGHVVPPEDVTKLEQRVAALENKPAEEPKSTLMMSAAVTRLEHELAEVRQNAKSAEAEAKAASEAAKNAATASAGSGGTPAALPADLVRKPALDALADKVAAAESQAKDALDSARKAESDTAKQIGDLRQQITSLDQSVQALPRQQGADPARVETLSKDIDRNRGLLQGITDRLKGVDQKLAGYGNTVPTLQTTVAQMKSGMSKIASQVDALGGSLSAEVDKKIAAAETAIDKKLSDQAKQLTAARDSAIKQALESDERPRAAALALAVVGLRTAVSQGASFAPQLETVEKLAGNAQGYASQIAVLKPLAGDGVASVPALRSSLEGAIPKILSAQSDAEPGDGLLGDAWNSVSGLVTVRPVGETTGDSTGAKLARAQVRLESGRLGEAIAEVDSLSGAAKEAASAWLNAAKARQVALQAVAGLESTALERVTAAQN